MSGKYFDDLEIGQRIQHPRGRTVTEMDNVLFSMLTMNTQPLHSNEDFASSQLWAGFGPTFLKPVGINETKEMLMAKYAGRRTGPGFEFSEATLEHTAVLEITVEEITGKQSRGWEEEGSE